MDHIICDGNHLVCRCVYATHSKGLQNQDGTQTGGTFTFLKSLMHLIEVYKVTPIVVFDGGHAKFRKELFPEYKQKLKPLVSDITDEERLSRDRLDQHFETSYKYIEKLLISFGFPYVRILGEEADDVIYKLSQYFHNKGESCIIYSGDHDYYQMVEDNISILDPKLKEFTIDNFEEMVGVSQLKFTLWKSIQGDDSDGIPGIKGIGPAKAKKIVDSIESVSFSDLENWAQPQETRIQELVSSNIDIIKRNFQLIDLKNIPLSEDLVIKHYFDSKKSCFFDISELKTLFKLLGFKSISKLIVLSSQLNN